MNVLTCKPSHQHRSAALVAASLLGTSIAWAGSPTTRSVGVSFRDLDLSTASGAATL